MCVKRTSPQDPQSPSALDYRTPKCITEIFIHWNGCGYYICPRCRITLEREFTNYCDRCGQCLDWSQYKRAKHIHGKPV